MNSSNPQNNRGKGKATGHRDTLESIVDKYGSDRSSGERSGKSKEQPAPSKASSGERYFRPSSSLLESPPRSGGRSSSDSDNTKTKKRDATLRKLEGKPSSSGRDSSDSDNTKTKKRDAALRKLEGK
ncbi:uncharacterized protein EAE98_001078 [Botrytis deweyae]|uniref:Uncharacterized protein n=1 Tax=Botrytis deweyae TaxID=2478750 RepID=A0ABQ7J0H1_9HELO|nr:uncharacterized protein EAE98_001078 [Botrytis deweyae]KAF7938740.1 hypothetical protein EAE98_001078 [Botrytis deweyae]